MKHTNQRVNMRWIGCVLVIGACAGVLYSSAGGSWQTLQHERELCRKAGLPLSITQWASAHVPPSQDSAPGYLAYDAARAKHDLSDADMQMATHLSFGHVPTDAEAARLSSVLEARTEVFVALDRALAKPLYSFGKNPDQKAIAYEYGPMGGRREAVMLTCAKGILEARGHHFETGAKNVAKGYRIGHQIGSISTLMGPSYEAFMDTVTSDSLGVILKMAGSDLPAATPVHDVLRAAPKPISLSFSFSQFCGECDDSFRRLRSRAYDDFVDSFPYGEPGRLTDPALWRRQPRTFLLRHLPFAYHAMVDAANAASLETLREIVPHADLPYVERRDWIRAERLALSPHNAENAHPRLILEDFESLSIDSAYALAHRNVVLAAANVLVYRAHTGRLPRLLSEADPEMPLDPFSGKPLKYQIDGKGGFTVSSVGQSAEDVSPGGYKRKPVVFHWTPKR